MAAGEVIVFLLGMGVGPSMPWGEHTRPACAPRGVSRGGACPPVSGPTPDSYGSLLELAWRGTRPIALPNGEKRSFLEDHDRLALTGWCQGNGYRVGFGEVTGRILPART